MRGYNGSQKTHFRFNKEFFWQGMRKNIRKFIRECEVCQKNKT